MKSILKIILLSSVVLSSCGRDEESQVKSEEVLVQLPVFLSQKFDTEDIVAFTEGKEGTKFGKKVRAVDRIPGVSVKEEDVIRSLVEDIELNKDAIAIADQSKEGRELLKDFSTYVYSKDKKGEFEDSLEALKMASEDGVGSIIELVKVWPAKRVDVDILKIMKNDDDFQRILDGLNDLNESR